MIQKYLAPPAVHPGTPHLTVDYSLSLADALGLYSEMPSQTNFILLEGRAKSSWPSSFELFQHGHKHMLII